MARTRSTLNVVSAALALFIMAFLVWDASSAAFTATTGSDNAQVDSVTIALGGGNGIDFRTSPLAPGQSTSRCVDVDFSATAGWTPSITPVSVVVTDDTDGTDTSNAAFRNGLGVEIVMVDDCTVGLESLSVDARAAATVYAGSVASLPDASNTWTPSGDGDARGFHVVVDLASGTGNDAMGGQALLDINWQVATTP